MAQRAIYYVDERERKKYLTRKWKSEMGKKMKNRIRRENIFTTEAVENELTSDLPHKKERLKKE